MSRIDLSLKTRAFVDRKYWFLIVVLVLVVLTAGWITVDTHLNQEFTEEERTVSAWEEHTAFEHSAIITADTFVWEAGERVENRPIYYANLSPELDGTYQYQYDGSASGELTVRSDAELVIRAIDGEDVFWEYSEPLATADANGLSADEQHIIPFTINILHVQDTISEIERQVDAQDGLVDVRVRVTSDVTGTVNDESIEETHTSAMPLVVDSSTYRTHEIETVSSTHEETATEQVPVDPSLQSALGSILVFGVSLAGLLGLLVGRTTGSFEITEEERDLLALDREREEYSDWISTGKFPINRDYETAVMVDSLEGLVDVAIDTNNRVIEDTELGASAVLDNDLVYVYVHPGSPAHDWLLNFTDMTIDDYDMRGR